MGLRRPALWVGLAIVGSVVLSRPLVPLVVAAVAVALLGIEVRARLRGRTSSVLVRLNGHPVHVYAATSVELGDRAVLVALHERGGVSVDGVHVPAGRTRQLGALRVEVE